MKCTVIDDYEERSKTIDGNNPSAVEIGSPGIRIIFMVSANEIREPTKTKSNDKPPAINP